MPLRSVMQHRGCPLDIGKGGYSEWSCECECHDEGYTEPANAVIEPTPGYAIPSGEDAPERSLTRTNVNKGTSTYNKGTKVGTHWTTLGGGSQGTGLTLDRERKVGSSFWVKDAAEIPLEERIRDRVKLTSKRKV